MDNAREREFWYPRLRTNLTLLRHAEAMYVRQKSDISREVIWYAIYDLRRQLETAIKNLGGMAGEW